MTPDGAALRHALNNLLAKVLCAAELAMLDTDAPSARAELELIVRLVQEGAEMLRARASDAGRSGLDA